MRFNTLRRRFLHNFSDPDMRAKVLALAGGKAIGLTLLLTAMRIFIAPAVFAQAAAPIPPEVNAINTAWTLIAAFLVFGMQVGFVMLEAGFARSREAINILVEGIVDTCICGVTFWAWGPDGWTTTMATPFHDFAGSTVVHSIGGAISLAGAIVLGPRLGRVFRRDGGGPMLPHNIILGAVGGLILWFGWYGFNPGSTLSALDAQGIGRVSFNTTMAACSAGLSALFYAYARVGKWDLGITTNGFLACLVAITCPCYWVSPTGAFFIGLVAGVVVIWAIDALEYLRIDDPIGAVPVHLVCGIWGTLSLGLFATGASGAPTPTGADTSAAVIVKGLFYGGGASQLIAQMIGSGAICLATLAVAFVLMYAVNATGTLRISREGELEGLDLHEHGMQAYPEYVIHGFEPTPHGTSRSR